MLLGDRDAATAASPEQQEGNGDTSTCPESQLQEASCAVLWRRSPAWMKALKFTLWELQTRPSGSAAPECSGVMELAKNDAFTF